MTQGDVSNLYIYQNAKHGPNGGMDIREIRRENLRQLLREFETVAALARAAGTDPAYISQIRSKKTKREIGDSLARRLEIAAGKERGWLDQVHEASRRTPKGRGALTRHEEAILEIYRQLPPSVRKRFLDHVYTFAAACGIEVKRVA